MITRRKILAMVQIGDDFREVMITIESKDLPEGFNESLALNCEADLYLMGATHELTVSHVRKPPVQQLPDELHGVVLTPLTASTN